MLESHKYQSLIGRMSLQDQKAIYLYAIQRTRRRQGLEAEKFLAIPSPLLDGVAPNDVEPTPEAIAKLSEVLQQVWEDEKPKVEAKTKTKPAKAKKAKAKAK